jgi:glycosyltransferase involved in cell wall biosynthesis
VGESEGIRDLTAAKRPDEVWAVYAGTLGANYDIPAIVGLARELPRRLANRVRLRFIVAGDGPLADLCRRSADDDLVFVGRLGLGDLAQVYRHADIALSTYRGASTVAMPIKAFDYMRFGLPVVNSLGRDLGALVQRHAIGINYEAGNPASLSAAVERLACDPELRRTMGNNALALAPEFAASRQYPKFIQVLEAVAQRRASTQ